jgi:hypothetical protein
VKRAKDCKPSKTTNRAAPCHEFVMCDVPEIEEAILHCSEVLPMEKYEREENGTSQGSSLLTIHWIHPKGSITQNWNSTTITPPFRSRTLERTQLCLQ